LAFLTSSLLFESPSPNKNAIAFVLIFLFALTLATSLLALKELFMGKKKNDAQNVETNQNNVPSPANQVTTSYQL
jgi:hypothetical protein